MCIMSNECHRVLSSAYLLSSTSAITIQFEQPTFTVEEQQGLISIPLVANQVSIQDHIVNVMGMNGTATLAESGIEADANLGPNQSILAGLFAGQTGIELLFNVFDDDIDEPDEFFTLTLLSVDGPLGGFENFEFSDPTLITTLTVTIIDNDIRECLSFINEERNCFASCST